MNKLTPLERSIKKGLDKIRKEMEDIKISYELRMQKARNIEEQWINCCPHEHTKTFIENGVIITFCEVCHHEIY